MPLAFFGPRGHGDHGAVGQHDHDVLVPRRRPVRDRAICFGGHVEGVAVCFSSWRPLCERCFSAV